METLLVFTQLPDAASASANALATHLLEERLASCVNVLAPCQSHYRWQGKIEHAEEIPLIIKTTSARYPLLEQVIRARHPYELPEIVAVAAVHGLPAYLDWVAAETRENN